MDQTYDGSNNGPDNIILIDVAVRAIVALVVGVLVLLRWRKNKM